MLSRPTGSEETAILVLLHLSSLSGSIFGFSPLKFWKIAFWAHSSPSSSCVMNRFSVLICGFLCLHHCSNRDVTSVPHTELLAFIMQAWEWVLTFIMDLKPCSLWTICLDSLIHLCNVFFFPVKTRTRIYKNLYQRQRFSNWVLSQIARGSVENFWIENKTFLQNHDKQCDRPQPMALTFPAACSGKIFPIHFLHINISK